MTELFTKLGIDWRLLLAQTVNFAILAFVLTKFLYKPLLKIISDRQVLAKHTIKSAEELAEAKRNLGKEIEEEKIRVRKEADDLLVEAIKKADALRVEATAQLEQDLMSMKNKALAGIEKERMLAMAKTKEDIAGLAILAAEKVLAREVTNKDSVRLAHEALEIMKNT